MLKTVPIADLKPNPYRRLDEYEIIREKVETLKRSIEATGFWGTIVARPVDNEFQIAFGHHRLVALQEGSETNVDVIVRDLSNEQMIKMMANENLEEWGHSALVEIETIETTLEAYGNGEIELPALPKDTKLNVIHKVGSRPYTHTAVAEFLGWTRKLRDGVKPNLACEMAFAAIDAMKRKFIKRSDLKGLKRGEVLLLVKAQDEIHQVHADIAERFNKDAEKDRKKAETTRSPEQKQLLEERAAINERQAQHHQKAAETKAKEFGKYGSETIRSGGGSEKVKQDAIVFKLAAPIERKVHEQDDLANKIARALEGVANGTDAISRDFDFLKECIGLNNDLSDYASEGLRQSFAALIKRLNKMQGDLISCQRSRSDGTYNGLGPKVLTNGRSED